MSKKKSTEDGEAKEHKQPWQERYATVGEIKAFLSDHVYLRYNTVNQGVLVFIGEQGIYKTTWFSRRLLALDAQRLEEGEGGAGGAGTS